MTPDAQPSPGRGRRSQDARGGRLSETYVTADLIRPALDLTAEAHRAATGQPPPGTWFALEARAARAVDLTPSGDCTNRRHLEWVACWRFWNQIRPNIVFDRPEPARHPNMLTARARRAITHAAHQLVEGGYLRDGADPRSVAGQLRSVADAIEADHAAVMDRVRPPLGVGSSAHRLERAA